MLGYLRDRAPIQKVTNRPKVGIFRAKQLNKLKLEEDLGILIKFAERYIKGYNNLVIKRQIIGRLYILSKSYQKQ